MNRNSLLNIADFFCQFFKFSIALSIIAITIVFIHFQIDRDLYTDWTFEEPKHDTFMFVEIESMVGDKPAGEKKVEFTDWNLGSLYFNYIKFAGILLLLFLSINQFRYVIKSVRKLNTFHQTNVRAFRKIGNYCLLISLVSIFSYWEFGNYSKISFSMSFNILLFGLVAYILAEIFKEGNNLMEENQLTI